MLAARLQGSKSRSPVVSWPEVGRFIIERAGWCGALATEAAGWRSANATSAAAGCRGTIARGFRDHATDHARRGAGRRVRARERSDDSREGDRRPEGDRCIRPRALGDADSRSGSEVSVRSESVFGSWDRDDDFDLRSTLKGILDEAGYATRTASNGAVALELLRTWTPRLILLDMAMPVMNGAEFRKLQLADAVLASVPTVVIAKTSDLDCKTAAANCHTTARRGSTTWRSHSTSSSNCSR
jgi:CheY-like chemotaxis protein